MVKKALALAALFWMGAQFAATKWEDLPLELQTPWLTGPLLTPSAHTTPKGHISIQPCVFFDNIYGHFNNHWKIETQSTARNVNFQTYINYGLTHWLDIGLMGQFYTNEKFSDSYTGNGDASLTLNFQLLKEDPKGFRPAVKLFVMEMFPTGNYNDLDPTLNKIDATGDGSYGTKIGVVFGKRYQVKDYIWIDTRYSAAYFFFNDVDVRNFNAYGGGYFTNGTVKRRGSFPISIGIEATLTRNLALALDIFSLLSGPNTFKGNLGNNEASQPASVGSKQIYQLSLAPAVEWNFTPNFGIIFGGWFSVYGKNCDRFESYALSFVLYK
jgi:hypothetical protein